MPQYILLIQGNAKSSPAPEEWDAFFTAAGESGLFGGGSQIGRRIVLGDAASARPTDHVVGYMRFDADDKQQLLDLLKTHPAIIHGASAELCEMPES
jgi:hypothetical protein